MSSVRQRNRGATSKNIGKNVAGVPERGMGLRVSVKRDMSHRKLYSMKNINFIFIDWSLPFFAHSSTARLPNVRIDILYVLNVYYLLQ